MVDYRRATVSRPGDPQRGVSLLETLIAVAILGVALSAVLTLRQSLTTQARALDARERAMTDTRNAIALLSDINPMATPDGARALSPGSTVTWRATLLRAAPPSTLADERLTTAPARTLSAMDGSLEPLVGLYRMDVRVLREEREIATFSIERLGWSASDRAVGD